MKTGDYVKHVFIVGAKGIGNYGGYETFVDKLTEYHKDHPTIQYHVACKANGDGYMDEMSLKDVKRIGDMEFEYNNARCFKVHVPEVGAAQAIFYDIKSLDACCAYIEKNHIEHPIVYILACRIGPFAAHFQKKIHKLGGKLYVNPDGHEWMRAKWSAPVRKYWKLSEGMMTKHADLLVCDSKNIEKYIHESYGKYKPHTTFIAYGAETRKSMLLDDDKTLQAWYDRNAMKSKEYYLVVGRFVPENNFETMIREFMKSNSKKDFAIITTANEAFLKKLESELHFEADPRIKFVGTVYDAELLKKIRENAYAYFHGHEVGGTNPSLLEALGSTKLNLLLDVGFNREVAEDAALYWSKEDGNLAGLIDQADQMKENQIDCFGERAQMRIKNKYSWGYIAGLYEKLFMKED